MEPVNEKREKLKEFYFRIKNCRSCELCETRTNFVFGSGNSNTSILFIGEAPGKNEDLQGRPFVGQAGKILDGLLAGIGLARNEVFIANVLKCRPPANRDPALKEIDTCKPYLFEQIEIIDPAIICTLGKYSTQLILDTTEGITKLRGGIFKINGRLVLPINHPAAALYAPSRISVLKEDFNRIKTVLVGLALDETGLGKTKLNNTGPDKKKSDESVPYKAADVGKVLEIEKVSESDTQKDSAFAAAGASIPANTKQDMSIGICSYVSEDRYEKTTANDYNTPAKHADLAGREGLCGQAGPASSEFSDESETITINEDDNSKKDINQDNTNQDNTSQQLGLF